jgi:hypothetical protein
MFVEMIIDRNYQRLLANEGRVQPVLRAAFQTCAARQNPSGHATDEHILEQISKTSTSAHNTHCCVDMDEVSARMTSIHSYTPVVCGHERRDMDTVATGESGRISHQVQSAHSTVAIATNKTGSLHTGGVSEYSMIYTCLKLYFVFFSHSRCHRAIFTSQCGHACLAYTPHFIGWTQGFV